MKKIMWVFLFILFLGIPKMAQAELWIQRDKSAYYYYDVNNTERNIPVFHNYETNMPVFMLNFKETPEGFDMQEIDVSEIPYDEEEIQWIKDVIAIIMDGRSYPEADKSTLVGIQVLLWELWSNKMNESIRYSFMVSYALVDYKNKVNTLRDTYFEPIHYSYQGKVNEKVQTSFVPNFLEEYSLKSMENAPKMNQDGNTFWFTADSPGDYEYLVDSSYFEEQVHFYKENDILFIELSKPEEKPIYLDYHIEEEKKYSDVHILPSDGVTSKMLEQYEEGETVSISYDLDNDYEILEIHAYTASGKSLEIQDGTFVMPNEDVVIQIETRKIPFYNVFVANQEGVTFDVKNSVKARETVEIHYTLENNYHLKNLKVTTMSGKEVPLENNTFVMPSENVVLSYDLEKEEEPKFYEVYLSDDMGGHVTLEQKKFLAGENVTFTYNVEDGYQLEFIKVKTVSGKEIPVTSSSFLMPSENVVIQMQTSKIPIFSIFVADRDGVSFDIKKNAKADETIEIHYDVDKHYHLKNLKITTTSGQVVHIQNNTFIMPSEDVILSFDLEKEDEPKLYKVYVQYDKGSKLVLEKNTYLEGETVFFTYTIESGYHLDEMTAMTVDGKMIPMKSHSFVMPNENVILRLKVSQVPSYSIFILEKKGITFQDVGSHKEGEKVSLIYEVEDSYELTTLKAYTVSGEEIHIENNTFIMPNDAVIILYELESTPVSRIFLIPNEHVEVSVSKNSYKEGENVTLSYEVENGFLLDSIHVYTITGVEIPFKNQTFTMPSDDVVVEFITKEKMDVLNDVEEQTSKEEIITYAIPKTKKNSLLPVLLLSLLIVFFFLKIFA